MKIQALPSEVWTQVGTFLPNKDRIRASRCCKIFYAFFPESAKQLLHQFLKVPFFRDCSQQGALPETRWHHTLQKIDSRLNVYKEFLTDVEWQQCGFPRRDLLPTFSYTQKILLGEAIFAQKDAILIDFFEDLAKIVPKARAQNFSFSKRERAQQISRWIKEESSFLSEELQKDVPEELEGGFREDKLKKGIDVLLWGLGERMPTELVFLCSSAFSTIWKDWPPSESPFEKLRFFAHLGYQQLVRDFLVRASRESRFERYVLEPFFSAAKQGRTGVIRAFLEYPPFRQIIPNQEYFAFIGALIAAEDHGHVDTVRLLLREIESHEEFLQFIESIDRVASRAEQRNQPEVANAIRRWCGPREVSRNVRRRLF